MVLRIALRSSVFNEGGGLGQKKTARPIGRAVYIIGINPILQLLNAYVTDLQTITVAQETDTALLVEETWVVQVVNSVWVVTLTVW